MTFIAMLNNQLGKLCFFPSKKNACIAALAARPLLYRAWPDVNAGQMGRKWLQVFSIFGVAHVLYFPIWCLGLGSSSRWPVFFSGSPQRPVSWVVQGLLRLHGCLHCLCHLRWKAIFGWKWQEHRWRWCLWVSYYGYKIDIKYGDNIQFSLKNICPDIYENLNSK